MIRWSMLLVCLIVGLAMANQPVDLSGKIVNNNGSPVVNAVVQLLHTQLKSTTTSDGSYHLQGTKLPVIYNLPTHQLDVLSVQITESFLNFNLVKPAKVQFNIYSLNGKSVMSINKSLPAGSNLISYPKLSSACYILKVQIDNSFYQSKIINTQSTKINLTNCQSYFALAKTLIDADTLQISKDSIVIDDIQISSLIDTLPTTFIIQREIFGHVQMTNIGKVEAVLWESDHPTNQQVLSLESMEVNGTIRFSTFAYFASDLSKKYSLYVKVFNNTDTNYIGCSNQYSFSNRYGNVDVGTITVNQINEPEIGALFTLSEKQVIVDTAAIYDSTFTNLLLSFLTRIDHNYELIIHSNIFCTWQNYDSFPIPIYAFKTNSSTLFDSNSTYDTIIFIDTVEAHKFLHESGNIYIPYQNSIGPKYLPTSGIYKSQAIKEKKAIASNGRQFDVIECIRLNYDLTATFQLNDSDTTIILNGTQTGKYINMNDTITITSTFTDVVHKYHKMINGAIDSLTPTITSGLITTISKLDTNTSIIKTMSINNDSVSINVSQDSLNYSFSSIIARPDYRQ